MKCQISLARKFSAVLAAGAAIGLFGQAAPPASAQVAATPPFEEAACLYTQAADVSLSGSGLQNYGDWGMYKSWLNLSQFGDEVDPGGWDTWVNTTEGNYNYHWGDQQTLHGTAALPDVLLSVGSMPYDPNTNDSGAQKLAWEDATWQDEANSGATMQHFVNLGNNIVGWHYKSVIVRLDYEFDGYWDPYGNLNLMSGMPGNFIKAWQNAVTTVRNTVKAQDPTIKVMFLWNPTDSNSRVHSADYYPGDAYVDYIGFDSYDADSPGNYQSGGTPSAANQQAAWTTSIRPRMQWFADFASAANPYNRNGYAAGRSIPLIAGEWGVWPIIAGATGAGGDDPSYIQNTYNWMSTHNVAVESYFEPQDKNVYHQLWPGGYPTPNSGSPAWGQTAFPNAAAKYRDLFGVSYSYGAAPAAIPGTVQAVNYDTGGQGLAYNQTSGGGQTGYRSDNSSALYGSGVGLGWAVAGQWYKYTVNVATAGAHAVTFSVTSPNGGGQFHLEDKGGGNLTGPVTAPATGDWNTLGTVTANVSLRAGTQVLKWVQDGGGYNLLGMTLTALPNTLLNGSFERPSVGVGGAAYVYNPFGGDWTFTGNAGIQANGSAWNATAAPDGTQTAFLQGNGSGAPGSMSQTVNFSSAGTYALTFQAALRSGQVQPIQVALDGVNVGGPVIPAGTAFSPQTVSLPGVSAGPHVLSLSATNDNSGDNSAFVDKVALTSSAAPAFTEGFESGSLNAWSLWVGGNGAAAFAQNCGAAQAHSGTWEYTNWASSPYQLTLYKNVPVSNGTHTVTAWVKSSGGQYTCQMEVTTGGVETIVPIAASAGWKQISTTVTVTTGIVEVGFYSNAAANQWLNVDDVVVN